MRTYLTGEVARSQSAHFNLFTKVEVKDEGGTWRDLTNLGGINYFSEAEWGRDTDQPVESGSITFARDKGTNSLAPLMSASTPNNVTGSYSPLIMSGRLLRISTAVTAHRTAPVSADWKEVFIGRLDEINAAAGETVTADFRDLGAILLDTFIEEERTYAGQNAEDLMQAILDDNDAGVTLVVPTSPGFYIESYIQQKESVLQALQTIADNFGWTVRYKYDTDGVSKLMLFQIDRTATASLATISPDEYLQVTEFKINADDIRNVVSLRTASGLVSLRTDAVSITKFGRRVIDIQLGSNSPIDTQGELDALGDIILSDLSTPNADQGIEMPYWWFVEIGDVYTFPANSVHYDDDQVLAVVSYKQKLTAPGAGRTTIATRGKPAGAFRRWLIARNVAGQRVPEISSFDYRVNPLTNIADVFGTVNDLTRSFKWWLDRADDIAGDDPISSAKALVDNLDATKNFAFSFTLPDGKGNTLYIQPYSGLAGSGNPGLLYVQPVARSPRTQCEISDRDPSGRIRADWAQINLSCKPSIPPYPGIEGAGTMTSSTVGSITDSAQTWAVDQFKYDASARKFYYVRVGTKIARIISNTATTLQVWPDFEAAPSGTYQIVEGATLYKVGTALEGFVPTIEPIFLQRTPDDILLEFYSEINLTIPEAVQRRTIDADTTPELSGITLRDLGDNIMETTLEGIDDDVKTYDHYARKGNYPTANGLIDGTLDIRYRKAHDKPIRESYFRMPVGAGHWYVSVVPKNSYNDEGKRVSADIEMSGNLIIDDPGSGTGGGTPTDTDALSGLYVTRELIGSFIYHRLGWAHTAGIESPDTGHEVKIYGYRSDQGVVIEALMSPANRRAWMDAVVGDSNPSDDAQVETLKGSINLQAAPDGAVITRIYYYRVELWIGGVKKAEYTASKQDTVGVYLPDNLHLVAVIATVYGSKDYIQYRIGWDTDEVSRDISYELWEMDGTSTFDETTGAHISTVSGKVKSALSMTRLKVPDWTPSHNYYYFLRTVLPDGTVINVLGPLLVIFDGAL